jgi:serine/threonine protein kinase/Tfp pilus assembly protein PilF
MNRLEQVQALFFDALDLPPEDRAPWLEAHCLDPSIHEEAAALLSAHERMSRAETSPDSAARSHSTWVVPTHTFGAYRAVAVVGRGGMSVVYRAERADGQFEQTVALKVMAAYLTGTEFLHRFEMERQLLASLNHHNIARLLDGGLSSTGDPFLITEYVDGQTVDRYCDERKLGVEARLRIFLQVCDAVDCAHRNLVVHRDLKPGNILVSAEGVVKLLDFGTASLLAAQADVTATRARMLTPRYASPEQLRGERVNIATDIFSLGVILYELLTGAWPFGDPNSILRELDRSLGDVAAKPPSTVVTEGAASSRSVTPEQLRRVLRGDISAIVLKALEFDPERRYESVRALAADVENFLNGRPVTARPQTAVYRTRKFLRRRWLPASAAAVFVLGLTGAVVVSVHQARMANAEARRAEEEARKSARVTRFLRDMFGTGYRTGGTGVTALQMLNASEPSIEKSWKDDPLAEATLRLALGGSYIALVQTDRAKLQLEEARVLYQSIGRYSDAADALLGLGIIAQGQEGRIFAAANYYKQALQTLKRSGKNAPAVLEFRLKVYLAGVLYSGYRLDEERSVLDDALAQAAREPAAASAYILAAWTHQGELLLEQGRFGEAEALFRRVIAADKDPSDAWMGLARSSWLKGDYTAAAGYARQNYELSMRYNRENLADAAETGMVWARYRAEAGETEPAVKEVRAAMPDLRKDYLGGYMLAFYLQSGARVFNKAGRPQEAVQYARESLEACRQAELPEMHPLVAAATEDLGSALAGLSQYGEAIPALEKASEIYRRLGGIYIPAADHIDEVAREVRSRR